MFFFDCQQNLGKYFHFDLFRDPFRDLYLITNDFSQSKPIFSCFAITRNILVQCDISPTVQLFVQSTYLIYLNKNEYGRYRVF